MILSGFKCKTCFDYLNDVDVFSTSVEEHLPHVAGILRIRQSAHVSIKLLKRKFIRTTVTYLGHVVKPGRLEIKSCAAMSSKEALPLRKKRELCTFLRLCNVYCRFLHNFEHIAGPLYEMLRKGTSEALMTSHRNN